MPKNIIVCCDGTNNEIAGDTTNVLRMFRMLSADNQHAFYDAGIGTNADPTAFWFLRRRFQKKIDMAVGLSIRPNVLVAYEFLMQAYNPGDAIFLFGFSRGAYTVRALAGMIRRCGILKPVHAHLKEYAWSLYSDEDKSHDGERQFGGPARLKKIFAQQVGVSQDGKPDHEVPIHFLGVWDTVSAFGWLWDPQTLPDTRTNKNINHIRHALSIDETRNFFAPNHYLATVEQDYKAVWFPGVHADVGGGYPEKESGLTRISLRWMLQEAKQCGLRIDDAEEQRLLNKMGSASMHDEFAHPHDEAKKWSWRLLSLLPRIALKVNEQDGKTKMTRTLRICNWPQRREIPSRSLVHISAKKRMAISELRYRPQLPADVIFVE